ncbi:dGTP triphosphohydrolase [Methylobacterium tarhaniae]|uniref:dGTP triphosphohydrolase n=1 Tax=Methylobacterium tarhaniae TaxID=1187852 RepID=UPI003D028B8F
MAETSEESAHGVNAQTPGGDTNQAGPSTQQPEADGSGKAGGNQDEQGGGNALQAEQKARSLKLYDNARDFKREAPLSRSDPWRRDVSIDWARVIHSPSFRRLQGKTQVFPGHESDFFRNRLTHSLEVAQIAEGIAEKLNHDHPEVFAGNGIEGRLCATAALMHDLGHPPFGHNGERALDDAMRKYGGFEGNAQTLRIISKLEKKTLRKLNEDNQEFHDEDIRLGLNLTYRSLASIIKYDKRIPHVRKKKTKLKKGYYDSEEKLVVRIKDAVAPGWRARKTDFKTIECSIMDLADDIAYSTYDLEDCFKAGFLTPAKIMSTPAKVLDKVAKKVSQEIGREITGSKVLNVFDDVFKDIVDPECFVADDPDDVEQEVRLNRIAQFGEYYTASSDWAESAYRRGTLSSRLVSFAIRNIKIQLDETFPALSYAYLSEKAQERVEVLKQYTFITTIDSPRVKVAEFRGYEVVKEIFKALASEKGKVLMPEDVRELYEVAGEDISSQRRVICDFVAGMTDRYAIEFYARLHSDSAQSMFKPL